MRTLLPGTVLMSRNADENENTSPGFWNHLAIIVSDDDIVEAQAGIVEHGQGRGVIITKVSDFMSRDYGQVIAYEPRNPQMGVGAAKRARALVGRPHAPGASVLRRPGRKRPNAGQNCVSVVKVAWGTTVTRIRNIVIPDGFARVAGSSFKDPIRMK